MEPFHLEVKEDTSRNTETGDRSESSMLTRIQFK